MKVDRAVSDHAAARQGDLGGFLTAEQRAEDADRGAHLADDLIGCLGDDLLGTDLHDAAGAFHFGPETAKDGEHVMDVAQVGNAVDDALLLGQECGG